MTLIDIQLPTFSELKSTGAFAFPQGQRVPKTRLAINNHGLPIKGSFEWGYVSGVSPQSVNVTVTKPFADKLVEVINAEGSAVSIFLRTNDIDFQETEWEFTGLSLMPRVPSSNTH